MFVIAILVLDIQDDIETAKGAGGEAENIDKAKDLALR
jgi:hypothetical protein